MRDEKYVQFVDALYFATNDAGTKIEPVEGVILVLKNALDPPSVHTEVAPIYID